MGQTGIVVLIAMTNGGCAVSIGLPRNERLVAGLCYVGRKTDGDTVIIDQGQLGAGLRLGTHDDAFALGWSSYRVLCPRNEAAKPVQTGFRWPLGYAWADESDGMAHEIGWIVTTVPEPEQDSPSLVHTTLVGVGGTFSARRRGITLGYRDRTWTEAPPDHNAVYRIRYDSREPLNASFRLAHGEK